MREPMVSLLGQWGDFYVMIGSAAATLTGLMFIVVTLVAGMPRRSGETIGAFSTPTVVHFCAALGIAAIVCAPWRELWQASVALGLCGLAGAAYVAIVVRRTRHQTDYTPVLEDWLWHTIFPLVSYLALAVAALVVVSNPTPALFVVGAAAVLLLFIGIHNAWDNVTFIVLYRSSLEQRAAAPTVGTGKAAREEEGRVGAR